MNDDRGLNDSTRLVHHNIFLTSPDALLRRLIQNMTHLDGDGQATRPFVRVVVRHSVSVMSRRTSLQLCTEAVMSENLAKHEQHRRENVTMEYAHLLPRGFITSVRGPQQVLDHIY